MARRLWAVAALLLAVLLFPIPGDLMADRESRQGAPLLENGDFESGDTPEGWSHDAWQPGRSVFTWEKSGGINNSCCVSIMS